VVVRSKVTLSDVAAHARVSTTTASYILNGRSAEMRIAPETEERVRAAAAELGDRPNRSARNLRTSTTKTFGVISDFVASGQYASQMLTGASAAARESGHLLVIGETEGDPDVEALLIEEMLDRQVDGIVYVRLVHAEVTVPAQLAHRRAVLLNCVDRSSSLPAVLPDELQGGRSAAELLVGAGVAGQVYVVGEDPTPDALAGPLRLDGVRAGLQAAGLDLAGVVTCDWTVEAAYDAVHLWLMSGVQPTALVCLNDRVAMGTYQALAANGLDVPRDTAVVSFDGSELASWLRPPLTSVALPFAALGQRAVRMLLDDPGVPGAVVLVPMGVSPGRSLPSGRPSGVAHAGGVARGAFAPLR
jgi:LacI family transcriptional regulator